MTNGVKVIQVATKYEGLVEVPVNSGDLIEQWQKQAAIDLGYAINTYNEAPWCAIFVRAVYREAGVPIDSFLAHPFTGYICQRADALGGLAPKGLAPPGSLFIYCSIHVGLVVRDRGNGYIDTIEGNANNMVRFVLREKATGRVIVPPTIEDRIVIRPTERMSYGFDDLNLKPKHFGPWKSRTGARKKMKQYAEVNPDRWVVPVQVERGGEIWYAFRSGPQGSYGNKWKFGGWPTKAAREREQKKYADAVGHKNLRDWSRKVPILDDREPSRSDEPISTH